MTDIVLRDIDPLLFERLRRIGEARGWDMADTLLQVMTPRHVRGRVMSIFLLNRGLVPIGALLAGVLASHFGGAAAMRVMSVLALGVIITVVTLRPPVEPEPEEPMSTDKTLPVAAAPGP